jgi:hypothetical protein
MITLGDIYLKLCYSLFASIIFLFINVQLPKEQKKLKSFVFVYNRITVLNIHLDFLVTRLGLDSNPKTILTKEMFIAAMQKTDPNSPVETLIDRSYKNWKEFIDFLKIETKNTLQDLLPLHDNIDGSILESLFYIENIFHSFRLFNLAIFVTKDRWGFLATDFYNIWYHSNNCNAALRRQYKHTFKQHQEKHYRETYTS